MIEFIRTPDERFENLPGYNFSPHYIEIILFKLQIPFVYITVNFNKR